MNNFAKFLTKARDASAAGNFDVARKNYRKALKIVPNNLETLLELGVLEGQANNMPGARQCLLNASKIAPSNADIWFNLAQVEIEEQNFAQAREFLEKTVSIAPDYAEAYYGLGVCAVADDDHEAAIAHFDRCLGFLPNDVAALHDKASCLIHILQYEEAEAILRHVLTLDPAFQMAKYNLAIALKSDADTPEAIALVEDAAKSMPLPIELAVQVADIYLRNNDLNKALEVAGRATTVAQFSADAHALIGQALSWSGEFDEAHASLLKAIEVDERHGVAFARLANIRRLPDGALSQLQEIVADETIAVGHKIAAGFALYRAFQDAKDYSGAFEALKAANALQFSAVVFDEDQHRRSVEETMRVFDRGFFENHAEDGYPEKGAVYVIGMPRSGTTLTEQILAYYPEVHAGGERLDVTRIRRNVRGFPTTCDDLPAEWVAEKGRGLHDTIFDGHADVQFATDKLPGNYAFAGFINWLLPKAKFVYCKRNPSANALSLFEQNFGANLTFSNNLRSIATVYALHERLMEHWISTCRLPVHTVDYEALVSDPEPHARALVDFIGLEWDPDCLYVDKVERSIATASQWQARQPIFSGSSDRWRRYEDQLEEFRIALDEERNKLAPAG